MADKKYNEILEKIIIDRKYTNELTLNQRELISLYLRKETDMQVID